MGENNITAICKAFDALSVHELYSIMRLRIEVFVVEQNCAYQDLDNKDQQCNHLCLYVGNWLAAYARLVPAGVSYHEMSIGRVITSKLVRGTGVGKVLMETAIQKCRENYGHGPIKIGAQLYAKQFYEGLQFSQCGDVYLEDGIEHIPMIRID